MKYKINLSTITFCFLSLATTNLYAADADAGKAKAGTCAGCHGAEGISANPEWPNLAGQKDKYLVNQMKAFRDGDRKSALMSPMAAGLSDDDIANIAAFYSGL